MTAKGRKPQCKPASQPPPQTYFVSFE